MRSDGYVECTIMEEKIRQSARRMLCKCISENPDQIRGEKKSAICEIDN